MFNIKIQVTNKQYQLKLKAIFDFNIKQDGKSFCISSFSELFYWIPRNKIVNSKLNFMFGEIGKHFR